MRKLYPLVLTLLLILAWVCMISRNMRIPAEYAEYTARAVQAYEQEYYLETLQWLERAENADGMVLDYEYETLRRNCYFQMGEDSAYLSQCFRLIEKYPETEENYLLVIQYYLENGNNGKLYHYLPVYAEKFPENKELAAIVKETDARYEYISTGYSDVKYANASLLDIQIKREIPSLEKENEIIIERKLRRAGGSDVFDWGYTAMEVSQSGSSCFVCNQEGKWSLVDISNHLLAQNKQVFFEAVGKLSEENIAKARINGSYHFINNKMLVSDLEWEDAGTFLHGVNAVKRNGRWALVTLETWEDVAEFPYMDVPRNSMDVCSEAGLCVVADEKGYYILDIENFQKVSENCYEELRAFESDQPTAYRSGDKWGFVNKYGNVYIEACYEDARPYINGYAAVKQNGLWGYIDRNGTMIVEPQFQDALNMMPNGIAYVQNESGLWDYIRIDRLYYTAEQ